MGLGIDPCEDWGIDQPATGGYQPVSHDMLKSLKMWFSLRLHRLRRIQIQDIEDEHGVAKQSVKAGMGAIPKDVKLLACRIIGRMEERVGRMDRLSGFPCG